MARLVGFAGGAAINLEIGEAGTVEVPDVVGDDEATATATLEGAGFVVSVSSDYSATVAAGNVVSQNPLAGTQAAVGATIAIIVSLGAATGAGGGILLRYRRRHRN